MTPEEKEYYSSHSKLPFIGTGGQEQLRKSKVLVIGAGGLGCPCLLSLAGAGVGTIGIADFDIVSLSNLHRQHLYHFSDAGKKKAMLAQEKLRQYNPFVNVVAHDMYVHQQNIIALLQPYDAVVDCTDNFAARYLINDACVVLNKPLIYGAIHRAEAHFTVFNYRGSGTLRCLFPKDENDSTQSCADIGAYNIITAITGTMMANETIKVLLRHADVIPDVLFSIDVLSASVTKLKYKCAEESIMKSKARFTETGSLLTEKENM